MTFGEFYAQTLAVPISTSVSLGFKVVLAFAIWHIGNKWVFGKFVLPLVKKLPECMRKEAYIELGFKVLLGYIALYVIGFQLNGAMAMISSLAGILISILFACVCLGFALSHAGQNMIVGYARKLEEIVTGKLKK